MKKNLLLLFLLGLLIIPVGCSFGGEKENEPRPYETPIEDLDPNSIVGDGSGSQVFAN